MLKVQHSVYHAPTLCALESFTPRCSDISLPRTEVVDYVTVAPGEYELFVAGTASVASTISTFTTVTWSKDLAVCNNYPLVLATAQTANNARFSIVRQTPFSGNDKAANLVVHTAQQAGGEEARSGMWRVLGS
eukprot:c20762_g1_i4.p2 GENE.c20762_g1_i4~~c20762_g1_i4.p2  ORF type:complete len:133 (+),score=21.38 c20762_g1_i4:313-711(+)